MFLSPQEKIAPTLSLSLSQELRFMLKILQMNTAELSSWIVEEVGKNPLLDLHFPTAKKAPPLDQIPHPISLYEHLRKQISFVFTDPKQQKIAETLIGSLDSHGFFSAPLSGLAGQIPISMQELNPVVSLLKTLDPIGVCSENLQECLLIQLQEKGRKDRLAYLLIRDFFSEIQKKEFSSIEKKLKIPTQELLACLEKEIKPLSFCPAASFTKEVPSFLLPDLQVSIHYQGKWQVTLNEEDLPSVNWNTAYRQLDDSKLTAQEKEGLFFYRKQARLFLRGLQKRKDTLQKIGRYLLKKQPGVYDPSKPFAPLTLLDIAKGVNLHPSTVGRALQGKAISTPQGVFLLKSFISAPLKNQPNTSTFSVKQKLLGWIAQENPSHPLTDQALCKKLHDQGIQISRRTITKYRNQLNIPNYPERKKRKPF